MYKVGDLVYIVYNPRSPGKIVQVLDEADEIRSEGGRRIWDPVRIRWLDNTETIESELHLNGFTRLIETHRRRLNLHEAKLPALEAL
jgi:hypothetical protein